MESFDTAKAMIRKDFPNFTIERIELAGEGMDSRAFFVNDDYVFRFPKFPKVAKSLKVEIMLLPTLQPYVRIPIPRFEYIGKSDRELRFVGYKKIEGIELKKLWPKLTEQAQEALLEAMSACLRELHSFPLEEARACGVEEHNLRRIHNGDFSAVKKDVEKLLSRKTCAYIEDLHKAYVSDKGNFPHTPKFLHADFGPGHIFCKEDGSDLAGLIDFGDVGIGDPDYDLLYLYGEFGWEFILRFLRHYHRTNDALDALQQKLRLILMHNTMEDLWMGIDRKNASMKEWALSELEERAEKMQEGNFY
jgi:aminoglycoside 2''-phosphotransferase